MFNEYEKGRTPNPDVLCNREIKFDVFMKIALSLGADFVATGHYCRKGEIEIGGKKTYQLLAGKDDNKDQSYFLCQLSQEQLSKALFPIGELTKPEVRKIAAEMELITAEKGILKDCALLEKCVCQSFYNKKLQPKEGLIVQIDKNDSIYDLEVAPNADQETQFAFEAQNRAYEPTMGKVMGKHQGAHYFTNGQRKGLNIGGTTEPLFVIATNVETNTIYTGLGNEHQDCSKKLCLLRMKKFIGFVRIWL